MKSILASIIGIALLVGCNSGPDDSNAIVVIGEKVLTRKELQDVIPNESSKEDSAALAQAYIQSWIEDALVISQAENLSEEDKLSIEQRVDNYRNALLVYNFEQNYIKQNLDTSVSDAQIEEYYNANKESLRVGEHFMKLKYAALPDNSKDLKRVSAAFNNGDYTVLETLCVEIGAKHFLNDSEYMNWEAFAQLIPLSIADRSAFLQQATQLQSIRQNGEIYLIKVSSFLLPGDVAPLEMVKDNISAALINIRKRDVIKQMRETMFNQAKSEGKFEIKSIQ